MSHFQTFEQLERASRIEHGTEIAPGVVIARRSFVFGALASGAALLTACQSSSATKLVRVSDNGEHDTVRRDGWRCRLGLVI